MPKRHDTANPIATFKVRAAEITGLVIFIILLADTAVTEILPVLKHIWHTIFGP